MNQVEPFSPELSVHHLGTIPYRDALALQLEHPRAPSGRGAARHAAAARTSARLHPRPPRRRGELALGEDFYRARGIEIVDTDRGGRVTYHGPGQLVGYPIMRVHDIGAHLRTMEAAIVAALADEDIEARSRCEEGPDYTGVWVEERKIASIGVHVSRGITTHGFAVNVDVDLEPFSWVIACGLPDVTMTSIARELPPDARSTRTAFARVWLCFAGPPLSPRDSRSDAAGDRSDRRAPIGQRRRAPTRPLRGAPIPGGAPRLDGRRSPG